jgi:hypothetical protein
MVNTFLTYSDYEKSAASLDRQRLVKQRVEAYQILCLIQDLAYLAERYGNPVPTQFGRTRYNWIRAIAKRYKNENVRFVVRAVNDNVTDRLLFPLPKDVADRIPPKTNRKTNITLTFSTPDDPELTFTVLPGDRVMKLGFVYHPSVFAWLNYEDALKLYINAHIQEHIRRGYINNMTIYTIFSVEKNKIIHPSWVIDEKLHKNHRAALLQKEKDRSEPAWYIEKEDFVNAGEFIDYIWPGLPGK